LIADAVLFAAELRWSDSSTGSTLRASSKLTTHFYAGGHRRLTRSYTGLRAVQRRSGASQLPPGPVTTRLR